MGAIEQLDDWFEYYNCPHPHKGLGRMSLRRYLKQLISNEVIRFFRGSFTIEIYRA
jgi:transposase InsO family protein